MRNVGVGVLWLRYTPPFGPVETESPRRRVETMSYCVLQFVRQNLYCGKVGVLLRRGVENTGTLFPLTQTSQHPTPQRSQPLPVIKSYTQSTPSPPLASGGEKPIFFSVYTIVQFKKESVSVLTLTKNVLSHM